VNSSANICREYQVGDIQALGDTKEDVGFLSDTDMIHNHIYAKTLVDGSKVMAVFGVIKLWDGVGQGFVMTKKNYHQGVVYSRMVKRTLDEAMKILELNRVQTYVADEFVRWNEIIGMKQECLMKKMSPSGGDLYLYARVI
jgi:hypothetical protein